MSLKFTTLDVFTSNIFEGNPLAIVQLSGATISHQQKQQIAREFNLSETVFLHESEDGVHHQINIFTTDEELPFAGHPTIGSGWFLLNKFPDLETVTLKTKAGLIPVVKTNNGGVQLRVPTDFKSHPAIRYSLSQSKLTAEDYKNGQDVPIPVASIVKGMTFLLLELSSIEALGRLHSFPDKIQLSKNQIGEWVGDGEVGFAGLYAFVDLGNGKLRARMFSATWEDPATGSAASTLCAYLAEKKGAGNWTFEIVQGVEMGRRSVINVVVSVDQAGKVDKVELAGAAVRVMNGEVNL